MSFIKLDYDIGLEEVLNKDIIGIIKPYYNFNNVTKRINQTNKNLKLFFKDQIKKEDEFNIRNIKNINVQHVEMETILNRVTYRDNYLNNNENINDENINNKNNKNFGFIDRNKLVSNIVCDLFVRYNKFLTKDPYKFLQHNLINIYYADIKSLFCLEKQYNSYDRRKIPINNSNKYIENMECYFYDANAKYPYVEIINPIIKIYSSYEIMMVYLIGSYNPNIDYSKISKHQLINILYSKYPELFKKVFKINIKDIKYYMSVDDMKHHIDQFLNVLEKIKIHRNLTNKNRKSIKEDYNFTNYGDGSRDYDESEFEEISKNGYYENYYDLVQYEHYYIKDDNDYNKYDFYNDYNKNDIHDNHYKNIKTNDHDKLCGYCNKYVYDYCPVFLCQDNYVRLTSYLLNIIYHNLYNNIKTIPNISINPNITRIKDKILDFHNIYTSHGRYYFIN